MIRFIAGMFVLVPNLFAQDVFLPKLPPPAGPKLLGHDGWVFSFHNGEVNNVCLDLPGGQADNGALLQIWECNGQEGQLWFFDEGTYQIQYAGDPSKCVDSGSMDSGQQLYLWDCNGQDQQSWGFDSDSGTVYLMQSSGDASRCMDIAGGDLTAGNIVQVWDCDNDLIGQHWDIMSGITIRLGGDNYGLCLDIVGGATDNGTPIQIWECNGLRNQLWIWETGTFNIKLAEDQSKCIDSGGGWNSLMLWDCNGQDQQNWGFDPDMGTIFVVSSSADASLCMDVSGGMLDWGTSVGSWDCNTCWNQQFVVIGPQDFGPQDLKGKLDTSVGDCPPVPSPTPSPSPGPPGPPPPSGNFQDLCADGAQDWPMFNSYEDLANNNEWSTYFQSVYGSIPSDNYPICVSGLWFLYKSKYSSAGISDKPIVGKCPSAAFDHYDKNNGFQAADASWIYHSSWSGVPGDTWVEVTHAATAGEHHGMWVMNAPGSGLWINTGNTKSWGDHGEAVSELHCGSKFDNLAPCAQQAGYDTIQFLQHHGNGWACPSKSHPMNIEIVVVDAQGMHACGGTNPFRAGWRAQLDCDCNENGGAANCGNTQIAPR